MHKSNNSGAQRTCSREPCKKDAHGSCANKACKFCCVVLGGCSIKGHNEAALSQAQLSKLVAFKGSSSRNPLPSPPLTTPLRNAPSHFPLDPRLTTQPERSSEELAWLRSKPVSVSPMQQEEELNLRKQQEEAEREAELERLEDEDYRRAVAESLSLLSSTSAALSPPASSQVLSPASETSTSILVQGLPVTRVNASNYPTITSHLSDDWMRRHEDRTKVPQAIRKGQVDSELIKRFRVVWWSKAGTKPVTIPIPSSDIRDWPKFRLADSPGLLERLGEGDIDFYDTLTFEWIECPILYAHAVKTDGYLLLRHTGIECEDFDTKLALATRKGDSSSRSYISNVRVAMKAKRKGKGRALELDDGESEGEVQIISDITRKIKQEPGTERPPSKRLKLSPLVIPTAPGGLSIHSPISIPSSPQSPPMTTTSTCSTASFFPFSALSSASATPPATPPTPTSSIPLSPDTLATVSGVLSPLTGPPPQIPGSSLKWPANMYVVDMVHGFRKMHELLKDGGGTYQQRFLKVFEQNPPTSSTYHDQVKRWKDAPPKLRKAFLDAGHTSVGHWSRFAKGLPLK